MFAHQVLHALLLSTAGIVLQLPLPGHLDAGALLGAIADDKDVDCLKDSSIRRCCLLRTEPNVGPCIATAWDAPCAVRVSAREEIVRSPIVVWFFFLFPFPGHVILSNQNAAFLEGATAAQPRRSRRPRTDAHFARRVMISVARGTAPRGARIGRARASPGRIGTAPAVSSTSAPRSRVAVVRAARVGTARSRSSETAA